MRPYFPTMERPEWMYDADFMRLMRARPLFSVNAEVRFKRFMDEHWFLQLSRALEVRVKNGNSVVPAWPRRMKHPATMQEFEATMNEF